MKDARKNTALLVVDVQNDVVAGTWKRDEVVATIASLVDQARAKDVPVIWVRHHADDLVQGTDDWQIVPELVPAGGEPIVDKAFGSAFAETDLEERLAEVDAGRILLCGAISNHCVNATMYGALYGGYDVTLIADAHTAHDEMLSDPRVEGEYRFEARDVVMYQNLLAGFTVLPGVECTVVESSDAFSFAG